LPLHGGDDGRAPRFSRQQTGFAEQDLRKVCAADGLA